MSFITIRGVLASDVADAGTFTVNYPNALPPEQARATDEGDFYNAVQHSIVIGQNDAYEFPQKLDITLGTSSITVTNKSGTTWPAGQAFVLTLQMPGKSPYAGDGSGVRIARACRSLQMWINLGAPDALVTNGVMAAQNRTNAGAMVVNGTLAANGVAVLDRPRNVIVDSGGADTATLTFTGTDEYGQTMSEAITLNGTTAVPGKKAFKTITAISTSAATTNTPFVGTGDVLGLPVHLPQLGMIVKELENGTNATAGTAVAGLRTGGGSTTTTADVRGTYDPNSACDGDKVFQVLLSLPDPGYLGPPQA